MLSIKPLTFGVFKSFKFIFLSSLISDEGDLASSSLLILLYPFSFTVPKLSIHTLIKEL